MPPKRKPRQYVEMLGQRLHLIQDGARNICRLIYERTGPNSRSEYFEILRTTKLGNHYHREQDEEYHILEGVGRLYLRYMNHGGSPISPTTYTRVLRAGHKVLVKAYTAHAFVLDPGTKMTCQSNKPWDPDKMDLIRHHLV